MVSIKRVSLVVGSQGCGSAETKEHFTTPTGLLNENCATMNMAIQTSLTAQVSMGPCINGRDDDDRRCDDRSDSVGTFLPAGEKPSGRNTFCPGGRNTFRP